MQAFRSHLKEHMEGEGVTLPAFVHTHEALNLNSSEVRETLNFTLSDITDGPELVDPVVLYERVREALHGAGYTIPASTELLNLFSEMEPDGDEVFALGPSVFLYFAFCKVNENSWDVLAEIVNEDELEEILNDGEL